MFEVLNAISETRQQLQDEQKYKYAQTMTSRIRRKQQKEKWESNMKHFEEKK